MTFAGDCQEKLQEVLRARASSRRMVYLDEVNFTKLSFQSRDWSGKNMNLTVDQREIYTGYRSVIVAMTEEEGMAHFYISTSAIDATKFNKFLNQLYNTLGR